LERQGERQRMENAMKSGRLNAARLAALAAAFLAGACTVTVDENNAPPRPRPPGPQICPRIYQPVCGERYDERRSFPNDCEAQARGFRVISDGECRRGPIRPPQSDPAPGYGGSVVCPQIYAPVCARQGNILRSFSNQCVAEASGFDVVDNGPC
jgi:hypothetical protein